MTKQNKTKLKSPQLFIDHHPSWMRKVTYPRPQLYKVVKAGPEQKSDSKTHTLSYYIL